MAPRVEPTVLAVVVVRAQLVVMVLCVLLLPPGAAAGALLAWRRGGKLRPQGAARVLTRLCAREACGEYSALESGQCASTFEWFPRDCFTGRRLIVVLEKAALELAPNLCRPSSRVPEEEEEFNIAYSCLAALLESPLNRAGRLLVYMHSASGLVVQVNPSFPLPSTVHRFARVVADLLRKGEVVSGEEAPLLTIVPGPVAERLPGASRRVALSPAGRQVKLGDFVVTAQRLLLQQQKKEQPPSKRPRPSGAAATAAGTSLAPAAPELFVFAIGASEGDAAQEREFGGAYTEERVAISTHELRATTVCQMLCSEFASLWGVRSAPPSGPPLCQDQPY